MHEKVAKLVIERATVIFNLLARHLTRWSCRASERCIVLARRSEKCAGPVLMLRLCFSNGGTNFHINTIAQGRPEDSQVEFLQGPHGIVNPPKNLVLNNIRRFTQMANGVTGSFMASRISSTIDGKCNHLNLNSGSSSTFL